MRYVIIFILLASLAAATDYTMYSPGSIVVDGNNVTFYLTFGSRAGLDMAVVQYSRALDGNDTALIATAKNNTLTQLAAAKRDDALMIGSPWKNFTLKYQQCTKMSNYSICFTRSTYYEEESDPLGPGRFSSVKIVNGTIDIPFAVSVNTYTSTITLTRAISPTTAYTGEEINVTLKATNTGNGASDPVFIEDRPPFQVKTGTASLDEASMSPGTTVTKAYTMVAGEPGLYNITGATSGVLQPNLLTVLSPISMSISTNPLFAGDDANFSIIINNTYDQDIVVSSLTISSDAKFTSQLSGLGTQATSPGERRLIGFSLPKGTVTIINGTFNPMTQGSYKLEARLSYSAIESDVLTKTVQFEAKPRELQTNLTTNGLTATLTLLNNKLVDLQDVAVQFSPEQTNRFPIIRPGESKSASFTYPASANATISLTYTDSQPHSELFNLLLVETGSAPPVVIQSNQSAGPNQNQQGQPPTQQNNAQPSVQNQTTSPTQQNQTTQPGTPPLEQPQKSIIKRFLDWLAGIFG